MAVIPSFVAGCAAAAVGYVGVYYSFWNSNHRIINDLRLYQHNVPGAIPINAVEPTHKPFDTVKHVFLDSIDDVHDAAGFCCKTVHKYFGPELKAAKKWIDEVRGA